MIISEKWLYDCVSDGHKYYTKLWLDSPVSGCYNDTVTSCNKFVTILTEAKKELDTDES